jgi:hypothetical protein
MSARKYREGESGGSVAHRDADELAQELDVGALVERQLGQDGRHGGRQEEEEEDESLWGLSTKRE